MDSRLLIDQIMLQTTVLIAQLSTAAGIRAPLAHIADEVFLHLSDSIEKQGVSRKVAADMFGMALRTYQRRVQALTESLSDRDRTLWEAVLDYVDCEDGHSREEVLHRFRWDDMGAVKAVLHDLVNSGLIYGLKQGGLTLYRVTPERDLQRLASRATSDSLSSIVWVHVYRQPDQRAEQVAQQLRADLSAVQVSLDQLVEQGRLSAHFPEEGEGDEGAGRAPVYHANRCYLPVGEPIGWAASVYDHFQAMAKAISNKLNRYGAQSAQGDEIGGMTLSFDLYPGHPQEEEVRALLKTYRASLNELWSRVVETNEAAREAGEAHQDAFKVTFYLGQNIEDLDHGGEGDE